ncbi:methyltransferase domain-containing protein [Okeania sp. SIO2G5]|uniref:methyltransferase domain-containing protein n=1 Tax=Okeania sp. SIO2G5 TaxID=2607796 RepID=UPI0013BEE803|nr:methyltransferase domain-containing protein [Okeania sp. SIO2G5]NEP76265.1 methyltransferase domain-containing protein [Okeania sp. SIO2G5]
MINVENFQDLDTLVKEAKALRKAGRFQEAITCFEVAIQHDSENFWHYHLLGCTLEDNDDVPQAIDAWEKALEVGKDSSDCYWAHHRLAVVYERKRNISKAIHHVESAIEIYPDSSELDKVLDRLHHTIGRIKRTRGNVAENQSENLSPQNTQPSMSLYLPATEFLAENATIIQKSRSDISFEDSSQDFPLPPHHLMEYGESEEVHLQGGKKVVDNMRAILTSANSDIQNMNRILEFGCSNGRLIRWLRDIAHEQEIWGIDIQASKIFWAIENLSPPFNFAVTTTVPHLPFNDGHFNFIFAGSIFTHIMELHVAWLLELRRVLAPGGLMYLTFNDEHAVNLMKQGVAERSAQRFRQHPLGEKIFENEFDFAAICPYGTSSLAQVTMRSDYIKKITSNFLDIISINPRAYADIQTGYLFKAR